MAKRTVSNTHEDFKPKKKTKKQKSQGIVIIEKPSPFEDGHPVRKFRVQNLGGGYAMYWCLCDACRAKHAAWPVYKDHQRAIEVALGK